jgi:hypothetical protein
LTSKHKYDSSLHRGLSVVEGQHVDWLVWPADRKGTVGKMFTPTTKGVGQICEPCGVVVYKVSDLLDTLL